jgi:hypothetical protein
MCDVILFSVPILLISVHLLENLFFHIFFFAVMLETKRDNVLLFATVSVVLAVGAFILWGPLFHQKRRGKLDAVHV